VNNGLVFYQGEGDSKVSKVDISLLNMDLEGYDAKLLETCWKITDKKKRECI